MADTKLDFVVMDSIVTTSTRSKNASKTAQFVSAKDRVKISPTVLYEDGGKLFCKPCSQVMDRRKCVDLPQKMAITADNAADFHCVIRGIPRRI